MIKMILLRGFLGLGFAALLSPAVLANVGLTQAEANTIIKEDLASTQVMAEVCPAIVGKNAKFDHNIHQLIQSYLQDYSDKSMTYDKLQADTEYKAVLNEARQAAKETSKDEQKSVCDDVVNYEA
ncbi:hypothetical protein E0H80_06580 [Acinetobacter sp. ANC 4779]|uniref:MCR_0457 family protein n=1 Tax=Acinetobacter sp. ANC 4779 TaxID=2529848 RepID=UPI0010392CFD|nr:hypothetical protein [Acinetobacter sp. ANC 4779]TCB51027.1 hypothetical protein E0H80_06580 [Acinetobacter sp. ANC 4779]